MKRTFCILLSAITTLTALAQFSSQQLHKSYQKITPSKDTVMVIMFNGITPSTDLTYTGEGVNFKWYKYSDLLNPISSGTKELYAPEDTTGYVLEIDGVKKYNVWIIDYKNHLPRLNAITPDPQTINPCEELNLLITANVSPFFYRTPNKKTYPLERNFKLKYATQKWVTDKWTTDTLSYDLNLPATEFAVTPPLCNTAFKLSGDQFATDFGVDTIRLISPIYEAVAVEAHLKTVVTERSENNEASRPQDNQPISYSVPIDVQFQSNASDAATFFNWKIYKDNQLIVNRTDRDHRYSFTEYGTYKLILTVSNPTCSYSDSITINAYESAIQVPNVFTPNGDGFNDEFRVAYKSLLSFECWIYNRWGRKLYHWNDPQKGWDGKIAGKDATEGAYFYVIKATGYGLDPKTKHDPKIKSTVTLSGSVALIRGKE